MRENRNSSRLRRWLAASCVTACALALVAVFALAPMAPQGNGSGPDGAQPVAVRDGSRVSQEAGEAPGTDADMAADAGGAQDADAPSGNAAGPEAAAGQAGSSSPSGAERHRTVTDDPEIGADYEADVALVTFMDGISPEELTAALAQVGCVAAPTVTQDDLDLGFAEVQLVEGVDVSTAMAQLEALPVVEAAQPNFVYYLQDNVPEPSSALTAVDVAGGLAGQAGRVSINDPKASSQWALESIHAYEAWGIAKAGDVGAGRVVVAVLDNGCRITHEDLKNNIVATYNAVNVNGGTDVTPFDNHGTHVCGIIAAEANNAAGIAGMSYNAGLLPIQVFTDAKNAYTSSIVRAYRYVIDNADALNIRVVNLSVGRTVTDRGSFQVDVNLINVIHEAFDAGILTTCSVGNDAGPDKQGGAYYNFPSDWLDCALGVIALGNDSGLPSRLSSSNYNVEGQKTKDIAAPGGFIYSTYSSGDKSYGNLSGTSMAAPCVAGVAALVFAANPDLNAAEVSDIICNTATDLGDAGWDLEYGAGEVNALEAVSNANLYLQGDSSMLKGASIAMTPSMPGEWKWASSDSSVASVDSSGTVTGVSGGVAIITASRQSLVISKKVIVYDVSFSGSHECVVGSTLELAFNENPGTGLWLISSQDRDVASVAMDGGIVKVSGDGVGTTFVVAVCAHNRNLVALWPITVSAAETGAVYNLGSPKTSVVIEPSSSTYSGKLATPAVTVKFTNAGVERTLTEGVDYTVAYSNNVNAGTAEVVLTGMGEFTGSKSASFEIMPLPIASSTVSAIGAKAYTGKAIAPHPVVRLGGKKLVRGVDYTLSYKRNVKAGTAKVIIKGEGNYVGIKTVSFKIVAPKVSYRAHVQNDGWQAWQGNGASAGTTGSSMRMEALVAKLSSAPYSGSIKYQPHVQNGGWLDWCKSGAVAGTTGKSLRLEAVRIKLTGAMAKHYDVYYRAHVQDIGWMGWAKNGAGAGTTGRSLRMEALQVKIVPKGASAPGSTKAAFDAR